MIFHQIGARAARRTWAASPGYSATSSSDLGPEVNDLAGAQGWHRAARRQADRRSAAATRPLTAAASSQRPQWHSAIVGLRRSARSCDGKSWRLAGSFNATAAKRRLRPTIQDVANLRSGSQSFLMSLETAGSQPKPKATQAQKKAAKVQGFSPETFSQPLPGLSHGGYGGGGGCMSK